MVRVLQAHCPVVAPTYPQQVSPGPLHSSGSALSPYLLHYLASTATDNSQRVSANGMGCTGGWGPNNPDNLNLLEKWKRLVFGEGN